MSTSVATSPVGPPAASCAAPSTRLDASLDAERIAALGRALAEPLRVSLLDVVRRHGEPLCQCQLMSLFGIPQSTLSHHVNKLVEVGLLTVERRHRWAYYSIAPAAFEELRAWLS
jgi:ArsR family transcriptional regulator